MDEMVLKSQQWVNQNYRGKEGYIPVDEDGYTGSETVNGLLRAFQIELGITATSSNFGPTTSARFKARFPKGIQQQADGDETEDNIYGIIQCACWCKGYSTGSSEITKHFYGGTGNGIRNLKENAGCSDTSSTVTINIMKALMSMIQFQKVSSGSMKVREMQQFINRIYESYIDGLIPCDGIYGRETNLGLKKAIQVMLGYEGSDVDGSFGPGTTAALKQITIPNASGNISTSQEKEAFNLAKCALYGNGYTSFAFDTEWNDTIKNIVLEFQNDYKIIKSGKIDYNTWMSLMISTGNPERASNACDTANTISKNERYKILQNLGIRAIGRYIVGDKFDGDESSKELTFEEPEILIKNGFSIIPIYQRNGEPSLVFFNEEQAQEDAKIAERRARHHLIPFESIIYFAVDLDVLDSDISNKIIPYFKKIKETLNNYKVGIYGTRNVCSQVMKAGYAETCYVSDLSTGYSGNMGFKLPENWNLDQYATVIGLKDKEGEIWEIDKVNYSGAKPLVTELSERTLYDGKTKFSGTNTGRLISFAKDKLVAKMSATDEYGQYDNNYNVLAVIRSVSPVTNPIYSGPMALLAKTNGKETKFEDLLVKDNEGNVKPQKSFMRIIPNSEYYLEYHVMDKDYNEVTDKEVLVHITLETTDF